MWCGYPGHWEQYIQITPFKPFAFDVDSLMNLFRKAQSGFRVIAKYQLEIVIKTNWYCI